MSFPMKQKTYLLVAKAEYIQALEKSWNVNLMKAKPPKRATHEVLQERGGMDKDKSASHIPSITQAYAISRKRSKKLTDRFKSLTL